MSNPYLLLDAGGTLLFPDEEILVRTVADEGIVLEPDRVYDAHFDLLHQYDLCQRSTSKAPQISLRGFFSDLLVSAGAPRAVAERATERLLARHEETSLWTFTKPWVAETLATLRENGISMAVISNSDGRVMRQLEACGIAHYFEAVFDSNIVGFEKPDARLFLHALGELGLHPEETVYVGDYWHVDVVGANAAGIGAIHIDPLGRYADWPGVRLKDIRALPRWISEFQDDPARFNLFPAGNGKSLSQD